MIIVSGWKNCTNCRFRSSQGIAVPQECLYTTIDVKSFFVSLVLAVCIQSLDNTPEYGGNFLSLTHPPGFALVFTS